MVKMSKLDVEFAEEELRQAQADAAQARQVLAEHLAVIRLRRWLRRRSQPGALARAATAVHTLI